MGKPLSVWQCTAHRNSRIPEFPYGDIALADGNQRALEGSVHSGLPWVPMASKKWRERSGLIVMEITIGS